MQDNETAILNLQLVFMQWRSKLDNLGGGVHIHIFMFCTVNVV